MSTLAALSKCQCGNDQQNRLSTLTYDRRLTGNVRAHCQVRAGSFRNHELRIHWVGENQTMSGTMLKEKSSSSMTWRVTDNLRAPYRVRAGTVPEHEPRIHSVRNN